MRRFTRKQRELKIVFDFAKEKSSRKGLKIKDFSVAKTDVLRFKVEWGSFSEKPTENDGVSPTMSRTTGGWVLPAKLMNCKYMAILRVLGSGG